MLANRLTRPAEILTALTLAVLALALIAGCNPAAPQATGTSEELAQLRQQNEEVARLRRENSDLARLRRDHEEVQRLSSVPAELAQLQQENDALRVDLAKLQAAVPTALEAEPAPPQEKPQPIANLPMAFSQAAAALPPGEVREEDIPMEGDTILVDQSVIGLLIPEFADNTNAGPYEVSGWLRGKGVFLQNYQQFNLLGITNYHVKRAPPESKTSPQ